MQVLEPGRSGWVCLRGAQLSDGRQDQVLRYGGRGQHQDHQNVWKRKQLGIAGKKVAQQRRQQEHETADHSQPVQFGERAADDLTGDDAAGHVAQDQGRFYGRKEKNSSQPDREREEHEEFEEVHIEDVPEPGT